MTLRAAVLAVLAAAALLLAAPARADRASCSAAYKPAYSVDWEITRSAWEGYCAKGYDAADALRQGQRDSMTSCAARFSPYEAKQKIPPGEAAALCAQGADGRARLAEKTGDRAGLAPAAPPPPPTPPRKPGDSAMGPFGKALDTARDTWKPDACFSGLYYAYIESTFIPLDEWNRARAAGRPPIKDKTDLEEYAYYFRSPSDQINAYRVSFGDKLEAAFCYKIDRMDGPDNSDAAIVVGLDSCMGPIDVDLPTAVAIATKNGWVMDTPMKAYLVQLPTGHFQRACRGRTARFAPIDCGLLATLDEAKLRRVTGKPMWVLVGAGKTAFVDAFKGRFRLVVPTELDLRAAKSFKYAEPCMQDKKGGGPFNKESE